MCEVDHEDIDGGFDVTEKVVELGGGAGVHQLLELQANHSWKYCFQVSYFSCYLIIMSLCISTTKWNITGSLIKKEEFLESDIACTEGRTLILPVR